MKIAVLGAGALGTLVAAALARECDVCVIVRDERTERAIASRGGVGVEGEGTRPVRTMRGPLAKSDLADIALLVVAVKTYATVDALAPLRERIPHATTILSMQNGIDAARAIAAALGIRERIALGPTTEAATWLEPGFVRRTAIGTTTLGWAAGFEDGPGLDTLAGCFTRCGLRANVAAPIEPFAWAKLVVNAAINPVTALANVRNGEILASSSARERAAALASEAFAVARAETIALPFADPVIEAERVMALTASNRSSMLQDFDMHRPSEIEAISGAILRLAARHGIDAPQTRRAYEEVRSREALTLRATTPPARDYRRGGGR